jgi:hypothetical protein
VTIEPSDFFQRVPIGADAYILSHIMHDWSEDQCLTILGHVRKVMNPAGRLFIVELVLASGDAPHPGKFLDMVMLTQTGGEERSETEYGQLLAKAGFRLGFRDDAAVGRSGDGGKVPCSESSCHSCG